MTIKKPEIKGSSNSFLSLPIAVPAELFEVDCISSDFIYVPIAVVKDAIILGADKYISIPATPDLTLALESVSMIDIDDHEDRTGYNIDFHNGYKAQLYLEHARIKAVVRESDSNKITNTGFIPVSDLINLSEGLEIKEGDSVSLTNLFEIMATSETFVFDYNVNFNTALNLAGIDFDLENESYPKMNHSDGRSWLDFSEIMGEISNKDLSLAKIVEFTLSSEMVLNDPDSYSEELKQYSFDPALELTLTTSSDEHETLFKRTYSSYLTLDFDELLEDAYLFMAEEVAEIAFHEQH